MRRERMDFDPDLICGHTSPTARFQNVTLDNCDRLRLLAGRRASTIRSEIKRPLEPYKSIIVLRFV
jgi:hypothetical protein